MMRYAVEVTFSVDADSADEAYDIVDARLEVRDVVDGDVVVGQIIDQVTEDVG